MTSLEGNGRTYGQRPVRNREGVVGDAARGRYALQLCFGAGVPDERWEVWRCEACGFVAVFRTQRNHPAWRGALIEPLHGRVRLVGVDNLPLAIDKAEHACPRAVPLTRRSGRVGPSRVVVSRCDDGIGSKHVQVQVVV